MRILPARLAVVQINAFEGSHGTARGFQHRLRRTCVPLHRSAEAWIQVGNTFGQPAEFYAGPEIDQLRDPLVPEKFIEARAAAVIAAREHRQAFLRGQTRMNRRLPAARALPGPAS